MALREPSIEAKGTRWDRVQMNDVPGDDYRSTQVRDLRDAVNEYIESANQYILEDTLATNEILNAILDRLEALEKNTPKGGYTLGGVPSGYVVVGK